MASDTLPVFRTALSSTLSSEVTSNYNQLVVEHIRLVAKVYTAISHFNLNDPDKAQETLQLAISEFERSH